MLYVSHDPPETTDFTVIARPCARRKNIKHNNEVDVPNVDALLGDAGTHKYVTRPALKGLHRRTLEKKQSWIAEHAMENQVYHTRTACLRYTHLVTLVHSLATLTASLAKERSRYHLVRSTGVEAATSTRVVHEYREGQGDALLPLLTWPGSACL